MTKDTYITNDAIAAYLNRQPKPAFKTSRPPKSSRKPFIAYIR